MSVNLLVCSFPACTRVVQVVETKKIIINAFVRDTVSGVKRPEEVKPVSSHRGK